MRGIFDSPRKSEVLYFNWAYVREGLPEARKGDVGTFNILCDSPAVVSRVATTIDDEFRNSPIQTRTETEQAFTLAFASMLGNGEDVSVQYLVRRRDVHHAAGFRQHDGHVGARARARGGRAEDAGLYRRQYSGDHSGRSVCNFSGRSGTIGFLLSTFLTGGLKRKSPAGFFLPPINPFDPSIAAACILVAVVIGMLSSFVPAWGASRTNIVEALRSTD